MSPIRLSKPTFLLGVSSIAAYALLRRHGARLRAFRSPHSRQPGLRDVPAFRLDNPASIHDFLGPRIPAVVVYTHAVCDVPKCEADPRWAYEVNVAQLTRLLAELPRECRFVYLSSDHVFRGDGVYTEDDPVCPLSVYGETRVAAETAVLARGNALIIRVGLPLGPSPDGRTGHVDWLRHRSQAGLPITLVEDESRSVVWGRDLADRIVSLATSSITGIRHVPAEDFIPRLRLARHLLKTMGLEPELLVSRRKEQPAPHIGRIELGTLHGDAYAAPLPPVLTSDARALRACPAMTA